MTIWAIISLIIAIVALIRSTDQKNRITRLEKKVEALQNEMSELVAWLSQPSSAPQTQDDMRQDELPQSNNQNSVQSLPLSNVTVVIQPPTQSDSVADMASTKQKLEQIASELSLPPVTPLAIEPAPLPTASANATNAPVLSQVLSGSDTVLPPQNTITPDESSPNVVTSLLLSIKNWFLGENLIVRVGALVLLVGVVLLLKLASQYLQISLANRMLGIAIAGLVTIGIGYKTAHNPKQQRRNYGLTLQGVGFAMIYLTVFTSFRFYQLLPSTIAFTMLAVVAGLTVLLSVKQNALPLAVLAFGGAFFAPILASNPNGSVVLLFGYYLLLNLAVAVIAHFRTWKLLNALSLFVTFGLAYVWGFGQYVSSVQGQKIHFAQTRWQLLAILLAHIGLYLFIAIRYSQQVVAINLTNQNHKSLAVRENTSTLAASIESSIPQTLRPLLTVDAGLLLGTAILGFGLLSALLYDKPLLLALGSGLLALVYLGLGFWLVQQNKPLVSATSAFERFYNSYQLLTETVLALGVAFLVLVIPLALSAHWVSVGWAIQGASLVWLGQRTARQWTVWFGLVLQAVTALIVLDFATAQRLWYAMLDSWHISHALPIQDFSATLPLTVLTLALGFSAFILRHGIQENPFALSLSQPQVVSASLARTHKLKTPLLAYSLVIATGFFYLDSVYHGVQAFSPFKDDELINTLAIAVALSILLLVGQWLHARFGWLALRQVSRWTLPLAMGLWAGVWFAWSPIHTVYAEDGYTRLGLQGLAKGLVGLASVMGVAKLLGIWLISRWYKEGAKTYADQLVWLLVLVAMATSMLVSIDFANSELNSIVMILPAVLAGLGLVGLRYLPKAVLRPLQPLLFWLNPKQLLRDSSIFLMPAMWLWLMVANFIQDGQLLGFYVPVLNPLDITLLAILGYLLYQGLVVTRSHGSIIQAVFAIAVFWTASSMLVRSFASFLGTPIWNDGAWQVGEVQTGLTILWSIVAMGLMFFASKKAVRMLWFVGMTLLGLVVIKLVMVDMSHTSAILRVVSFIGAGILMLVIGYLAPLPPMKQESEQKAIKREV